MTFRLTLLRLLPVAVGASALLYTLSSAAQDSGAATGVSPAAAFTTRANIGLTSQYVFRGLAQTNEKPALQGGFDVSHESVSHTF